MAKPPSIESKTEQRLLLLAQLLTLVALALGLQFLLHLSGGTLFMFSTISPVLVLGSIGIFGFVALRRFRRRHQLFHIQTYEPGDVIFHEGTHGDCAYFIQEGEVEVVKDDAVVAKLEAGHHFGEMAMLSDEPRNATVRAIRLTRVALVGKENFLAMLRVAPSTEKDILSTIQSRAMELAEH